MLNNVVIERFGGLTSFSRSFAAPGISILDGIGKSSFFNALCLPQFVARGVAHLSQFSVAPSGFFAPAANGGLIVVSFGSFGESYRYGFGVSYDAQMQRWRLSTENLSLGSGLAFCRDGAKLTEYENQIPKGQWDAPVDSFFLPASPATPHFAPITAARNALANMFLLRPEPHLMASTIDVSIPLQPNCSNFAGWLFSFLSANPMAYASFDNALARMLDGRVTVKTPLNAGGVRHLQVLLPKGSGEIPFHCLADHEKLAFVVAAVCAFNRHIPGTVCVWDGFEQVFLRSNAERVWSCLWDGFAANGQFVGLCPHRYIPSQGGRPAFEWL